MPPISVLPTIQQAFDILRNRKDKSLFVSKEFSVWDIVNRIQKADPYIDKRFAPVIAEWVVDLGITPEEHSPDIAEFKELRRRLKHLRIPATNPERKRRVKDLLSRGPGDFVIHYSVLRGWNIEVSDILDPKKDLSDVDLPVVMRHGGYTMYRIDTEEHCRVPLVKNTMSWCVTKGAFGQYGGPPYYPIVRDHDKSPFAMIIPAYFGTDPDQAVRNSSNTGRLSSEDLAKVRPLVRHVLPLDGYSNPYIKGVHGVKPEFPKRTSPSNAFDIIRDHAITPGEWPEGEQAIAREPKLALRYAQEVIGGPFPLGEEAISREARCAYEYAADVIKRPFLLGEPMIAQYGQLACQYAWHVLDGPFLAGEKEISQNASWSCRYAQFALKGRFPLGEWVISRNAEESCRYAIDVIKGPWLPGEEAFKRDPRYDWEYKQFLAGRAKNQK